MNRFVEESDINVDDTGDFAFIDRMDHRYDEPSESPITADSNPDSPFIGKSAQEVSQMLRKLCEDTGSEIMVWYIIIMDERTLRDDTVLLTADDGDAMDGQEIETVRATFEVAADEVVLFHTGHRGIEEDQWKAEKDKDGVFRGW